MCTVPVEQHVLSRSHSLWKTKKLPLNILIVLSDQKLPFM